MPNAEGSLLPDEKIVGLAELLDHAAIPHAFGGAIALVYWSEPRGTVDIDVNIFLSASDTPRVFAALRSGGIETTEEAEQEARQREQVRIDWDGTPIDLFFAYDPFHDSCAARAQAVDFMGHAMRVLSAEDIVIFKALYDRPKDWVDVEQLLAVQAEQLDAKYVRNWIERVLPPEDSARSRLDDLLQRYSG